MRLASGFGGGLAGKRDLCGALTGCVMIIGALYGRETPAQNEAKSRELIQRLYDRFLEAFPGTDCGQIRDAMPPGTKCTKTVETATKILLELIPDP